MTDFESQMERERREDDEIRRQDRLPRVHKLDYNVPFAIACSRKPGAYAIVTKYSRYWKKVTCKNCLRKKK